MCYNKDDLPDKNKKYKEGINMKKIGIAGLLGGNGGSVNRREVEAAADYRCACRFRKLL